MSKILQLSFLLLISCSSVQQVSVIPYVLDLKTEKSIYNEILNSKGEIVFYVEQVSDSMLKFHLVDLKNKETMSTNRRLFINDRFYPIVFDTDYLFYSESKDNKPVVLLEDDDKEVFMPTISEREKNISGYGYKKKAIILDYSIYWIVNKKGELIKTNSSPDTTLKPPCDTNK